VTFVLVTLAPVTRGAPAEKGRRSQSGVQWLGKNRGEGKTVSREAQEIPIKEMNMKATTTGSRTWRRTRLAQHILLQARSEAERGSPLRGEQGCEATRREGQSPLLKADRVFQILPGGGGSIA
jgi:hypothetical protein